MVAYPRDVLDQRANDLYARLDTNGNRALSPAEAGLGVRKMRRNRPLREAAADVFGLVPRSGAELMRFVAKSPRQEAHARIFCWQPMRSLGSLLAPATKGVELGKDVSGRTVAVAANGAITIDGAVPEGLAANAHAIDAAAALASGVTARMTRALQERFFATLSDQLVSGASGAPHRDKDAQFSGAMALLIALGRVADSGLRAVIVDRVLWGLSRQHHSAMREFYLAATTHAFGAQLDPAQRVAVQELGEVTVRTRFPVEEWTESRTKPLRVSQIVNDEFWRRVSGYYRKRGFKLISQNSKDSRRVYERVMKDPSGSKAPLTIRVELAKGEDDLYAKMDRRDIHVIVYDGHWQLGGNGTQSISHSPDARGVTKLIVQDGCRTIQNYDEFIDRHREAMVIGSLQPILADSRPILDTIFEGIVRGETLAWVRQRLTKAAYFTRNEYEQLRQHADLDNDERADHAGPHEDAHFDVYRHRTGSRFVKALESANTSLYYHHDGERDEGRRSYLGATFGDHVVAGGVLADPRPGEVVRVTPVKGPGKNGKSETFYEVAYNPAYTFRRDEEYAGIVTAHVIMELTRLKLGTVSDFDRLRAIVMGAASIQFLGVYAKRGNNGMKGYLAHFGLPAIPPKKVIEFLEEKEAYGNDEQVQRFAGFLGTYGYRG